MTQGQEGKVGILRGLRTPVVRKSSLISVCLLCGYVYVGAAVRSPGAVIVDSFALTNMSAGDRTGVLSKSSKNS